MGSSVALSRMKARAFLSVVRFTVLCRFPAVFAGFRRFTMVSYYCLLFFDLCGEVAFFRGEVLAMAKGKTKEVQGGNQEGRKGKVGRPRKVIPIEDLKKALRAAEIGIPLERVAILCGFPSGNAGPWHAYLKANPDFAGQLEKARLEGELDMSCVVRTAGPGWQGSAWLLERTRGYVARAQLDHTTKGKELSVSGSLLGAFGGVK